MDKNIGLSAGLVALLALAAHVALPTGSERGSDQSETGAQAKKSKAPPADKPPRDNFEGPWLATRQFFMPYGPPDAGKKSPVESVDLMNPHDILACSGKCLSELRQFFGIGAGAPVECLLATVPDPNHTRLALFTDHSIEAVWKGAEAAGWEFAAQWLPWNDAVDPDEGDPVERARERRFVREQEMQPGALVFRHAAGRGNWGVGGLVIFVVGETPTAGVNARQFQIARAYMTALGTPGPGAGTVKIAGPTFSGSFDSLAFLIRQDSEKQPGLKYEVRSGTAQSQVDAEAFENRVGPDIGIDFHSATQSLGDQDSRLHDVMDQLGIPLEQAAVVAEDESTFGSAATDDKFGLRTFRFPRDISHLRDTYRQAQQNAKLANGPGPGLDFSLKDPSVGEDSVPTYSQTQTPLSQNAVINEIARAIRRLDIRMVEVSATNPLDLLFVAGSLRRQCPGARLLFQAADLLFVQAEQTQALDGTLVLSSYPMFAESNMWDSKGEIKVFSDSPSQGVFNATLLLLSEGAPAPGTLADYAWKSLPYPRDWLLILDRQGFTPVRVWDNDATECWFESALGTTGTLSFAKLTRAPALALLAGLSSAFGIVLGAWVILLKLRPGWRVDARLEPVTADGSWHGFYLLLFMLIAVGIQLAILAAAPTPRHWARGVLTALGILLPAIAAAVYCRPGNGHRLAGWLTAAALMACLALWIFCCRGQGMQSRLFSYRAAELRLGSSPLWPVAAAVAALLLWCFAHVARLYFAYCGQPEVATDSIEILKGHLTESWKDFKNSATSALGLSSKEQKVWFGVVLAASVLLFFLCRVNVQLGSIDGWNYDWVSIPLLVTVAGLLLVTCWQIHFFWKSLHRFTTNLGLLPLTRAFVRASPPSGNRPIWVRRSNLLSVEVHTNSVLVLHDMGLQAEQLRKHGMSLLCVYQGNTMYREALRTLLDAKRSCDREKFLEGHRNLWRLSSKVAIELLPAVKHGWGSAPLFQTMMAAAMPEESPEQDAQKPAAGGQTGKPGETESVTDLAERFLALHYTPFLLYAVHQIQNLLWFSPIGFVLLMFAMNSYSFQSRQWIGTFLMLLFAIITVILGRCMVQMERDPILSRIAGTKPGQLGAAFYLRLARYGALPVLGLLAHQFPAISNALLSGVQPALEALK